MFVKVGQNSYGVLTLSMVWGICPRCGAPLGKPTLADIIDKPNGMEELRRVLEEAKQMIRVSFRSVEGILSQISVPGTVQAEEAIA